MTPVSFRTMKAMPSRPQKPTPPAVLVLSFFSLFLSMTRSSSFVLVAVGPECSDKALDPIFLCFRLFWFLWLKVFAAGGLCVRVTLMLVAVE